MAISHLPDSRDQFAVDMQIAGNETFVQLKRKKEECAKRVK